jgi:hypothetical protein
MRVPSLLLRSKPEKIANGKSREHPCVLQKMDPLLD